MEKKLTEAQARPILSMARERNQILSEIGKAMELLCKTWAADEFKDPVLDQREDGLYIVERNGIEGPPKLPELVQESAVPKNKK